MKNKLRTNIIKRCYYSTSVFVFTFISLWILNVFLYYLNVFYIIFIFPEFNAALYLPYIVRR